MTREDPESPDESGSRADAGPSSGSGRTDGGGATDPPNDAADPKDDSADEDDSSTGPTAVLLDVLPSGRPDDDRPGYQKSPVAYALGAPSFRLYECSLDDDADVAVSDRIQLDGEDVSRYREVEFDDLTRNAAAEIEYAVEAIVDDDERRFVDFYNEAGPITLRLHQLNLLPGIGKKLRNKVLDERKRGPFESFEEVEERVPGLHRPREVIVERIVEEIRKEDLKYRRFAGYEE
ncbi:MAG: DUF655 domain-containing protein [Halorubrum sp.]